MSNEFYKTRKILAKDVKSGEFYEKILKINKVSKTVKGGRVFSFAVVAAIGNKNGIFGIGKGVAKEVVEARKKAVHNAKTNLYEIPLTKDKTINHSISTSYCSSSVFFKPAKIGTGLVCGSFARQILEIAGVQNIIGKILGSRNVYNVSYAVIKALLKLHSGKFLFNKNQDINKTLDSNIS